MSGDINISLDSLGELAKPATVLIEKISDAVGGLYKPYQIERVAKASAKAELIREEAAIQVTDLRRRALSRFVEEESQRQANIESITGRALPLLSAESNPAKMEKDWITNFFDKSRIVSDSDMQELWSRVLASEANHPGGVARRTVNLLADLDRQDALNFSKLCEFAWVIGDAYPLVFNIEDAIYKEHGMSFGLLTHLDSLGLITYEHLTGYVQFGLAKTVHTSYKAESVILTFPKDADNTLDMGHVLFTRAGQQLAHVCTPSPVPGFAEYVKARWTDSGLLRAGETAS